MNKALKEIQLSKIIESKNNFIFISPHLDDAVFSLGGLMNDLKKRNKKILIINVFTESGSKPYTFSVKRFLQLCGYESANDLFKDRLKEDKRVASKLNAKAINLGFTDALWRKKSSGSILPELDYIYPIFRLTIARGKISKHDNNLLLKIESALKKNVSESNDTVVFCPLAIGNHTDHLIVRNIVSKIFTKVIFWEDYPYIKNHNADIDFIKQNKLKKHVVNINLEAKNLLVNMYKSQIKAIFGKDRERVERQEAVYL